MNTLALAKKLLVFLSQKEDLETQKVLKTLSMSQKKRVIQTHETIKAYKKPEFKTPTPVSEDSMAKAQEAPKAKDTPIPSNIYSRLVHKIKKACPELRIKESFTLTKAQIPDCDVILLCAQSIPEVYQSLMKAIDKQLALTESCILDATLIDDLCIKNFKLILADPELKKAQYLMKQIKLSHDLKTHYLGSSKFIFLDGPSELVSNIPKKQVLWQTIKTILS
jgi:hypothetical protein